MPETNQHGPVEVSKDAQAAWATAKSADEKKAIVAQFPELRHLFAQALDIYNQQTK
jgi:hypothetical protein